MREFFERNINIGDLVYSIDKKVYGIIVENSTIYTHTGFVKLEKPSNVLKITIDTSKAKDFCGVLNNKYKLEALREIKLSNVKEEVGNLYVYKSSSTYYKSHEIDFYVVYLGIATCLTKNKKYENIKIYIEIENDVHRQNLVKEILETSNLCIDSSVFDSPIVKIITSKRSLKKFDDFEKKIEINNLNNLSVKGSNVKGYLKENDLQIYF